MRRRSTSRSWRASAQCCWYGSTYGRSSAALPAGDILGRYPPYRTAAGASRWKVRLFRRMQDKVRNKLTKRQYENEVSWSTSTWFALQAQRLSVAVHIASAWEIATEMQLAGGGGEAPSSDKDGAPPRRESTPYFVGPRCVFVCVCVCFCVYSRVGASYVGRPIRVYAVSAPLRRVNIYMY